MEPQAGRRISPFGVTKRSNYFLRKTTRRSRVHVQTIGQNAETKKCRHRADGEICLLTFPFIGLLRSTTPREQEPRRARIGRNLDKVRNALRDVATRRERGPELRLRNGATGTWTFSLLEIRTRTSDAQLGIPLAW